VAQLQTSHQPFLPKLYAAGGVAQVQGPEFEPQYQQKKKILKLHA
jgi:hypothetical protein